MRQVKSAGEKTAEHLKAWNAFITSLLPHKETRDWKNIKSFQISSIKYNCERRHIWKNLRHSNTVTSHNIRESLELWLDCAMLVHESNRTLSLLSQNTGLGLVPGTFTSAGSWRNSNTFEVQFLHHLCTRGKEHTLQVEQADTFA